MAESSLLTFSHVISPIGKHRIGNIVITLFSGRIQNQTTYRMPFAICIYFYLFANNFLSIQEESSSTGIHRDIYLMGSILVLPVDNRSRNIVGNQRCGIRLANLVAPTIEIDTGRLRLSERRNIKFYADIRRILRIGYP